MMQCNQNQMLIFLRAHSMHQTQSNTILQSNGYQEHSDSNIQDDELEGLRILANFIGTKSSLQECYLSVEVQLASIPTQRNNRDNLSECGVWTLKGLGCFNRHGGQGDHGSSAHWNSYSGILHPHVRRQVSLSIRSSTSFNSSMFNTTFTISWAWIE